MSLLQICQESEDGSQVIFALPLFLSLSLKMDFVSANSADPNEMHGIWKISGILTKIG